MERNELQDENGVLRNEILELQNALAARLAGNPGWDHGTAGLPLPVPHSASIDFPSQQPMQPPIIASAIFSPLQQPAPPRELKLFPDAASDMEGPEPSEDQEPPSHIARPQARYPTQSAAWPVSLGLPRMEDEQCSSNTTGSSKEGSSGRDWVGTDLLNLSLRIDWVDQFQPIRKFFFERSEYTQLSMCL
jgi:hypothetical protein